MPINRRTSGPGGYARSVGFMAAGPLQAALQEPERSKLRMMESISNFYRAQQQKREQRKAERGGGGATGAAIGAAAGALLAPFTFGASLAVAPAAAAGGTALGAAAGSAAAAGAGAAAAGGLGAGSAALLGGSVGASIGKGIGEYVKPAGSPEAKARDDAFASTITEGILPLGAGLLGGAAAKRNPRTMTDYEDVGTMTETVPGMDEGVGTEIDEFGNPIGTMTGPGAPQTNAIGTEVSPVAITEQNPFRRGFLETYNQAGNFIDRSNPFFSRFLQIPGVELPSKRFGNYSSN